MTIFLTGATGFIGGAVAARLVADDQEATAKVSERFVFIFGSNCRVGATRARSELNWQPRIGSMLDWTVE